MSACDRPLMAAWSRSLVLCDLGGVGGIGLRGKLAALGDKLPAAVDELGHFGGEFG